MVESHLEEVDQSPTVLHQALDAARSIESLTNPKLLSEEECEYDSVMVLSKSMNSTDKSYSTRVACKIKDEKSKFYKDTIDACTSLCE